MNSGTSAARGHPRVRSARSRAVRRLRLDLHGHRVRDLQPRGGLGRWHRGPGRSVRAASRAAAVGAHRTAACPTRPPSRRPRRAFDRSRASPRPCVRASHGRPRTARRPEEPHDPPTPRTPCSSLAAVALIATACGDHASTAPALTDPQAIVTAALTSTEARQERPSRPDRRMARRPSPCRSAAGPAPRST